MRRAFTLIEVLVAVAIASIAGLAMLKMSSSQLFFISKLQNYSQMQDLLTMPAFTATRVSTAATKRSIP